MGKSLGEQIAACCPGIDVLFDDEGLDRFSRDESCFSIRPAAVARVRSSADAASAVQVAASNGASVTARAGGTSVAGQCLGQGIIVDTSAIDHARVEGDEVICGPGVVLDDLNRELAGTGRMIGPDTTSSAAAMVGGLVSTNACGSRSAIYGRFAGAVLEAEVITAKGAVERLTRGVVPTWLSDGIDELAGRVGLATYDWPKQPRSYGGYRLDAFAERGDALSLIPGSEGTLCLITEVRLATVPLPKRRLLSMAAFGSLDETLEAASICASSGAAAVELVDSHILEAARQNGMHIPSEGDTGALLLIEHLDWDEEDLRNLDRELGGRVEVLGGRAADEALKLRTSALSLVSGMGRMPLPLFEDPAVGPASLREFCDELAGLLRQLGLDAVIYGHADVGCLHVRPLCDPSQPGLTVKLRDAALSVAELVREFGGSITGEHGWGMSRSFLAQQALGEEAYECFQLVKQAFDPDGVFNPGVIVGGRDPFAWLALSG